MAGRQTGKAGESFLADGVPASRGTPLQKMTYPPVPAVKPLSVRILQVLHDAR